MTAKKKENGLTTTVFYKGQEIEIDLTKKAPIEILEVKTKPMTTTPVKRQTPD